MLAQYLDVTNQFNENGGIAYVEMSNYDYCVIQLVGVSQVNTAIYATIDSGAIEGQTDGDISTSTNYTQVSFTDLSDGTTVQTISTGLLRVNVVGRYLQINNPGSTASKILVMLAKIS